MHIMIQNTLLTDYQLQAVFTEIETIVNNHRSSTIIYGAMAQWLRRSIPNPGVSCSKPLGGSIVDSAFHPSEIDKMSTKNFWELSGKK